MRIAVVGDVHWCTYSSIVRQRGTKYSKRLENLVKSIQWCEETADKLETDIMVYLGDFFDRPDINAEELSALGDIEWNYQNHYFIAGNHEMGRAMGDYSSAYALQHVDENCCIITAPSVFHFNNCNIAFLPYILESNRTSLSETFPQNPDIIFSHNDIKMQYGKHQSIEGYDIADIEKNCKLFINGHLHNHNKIDNGRIINLGNITGQNFSEDASEYKHYMMILDTDTLKCEYIQNPYALEFYKIDETSDEVPFIDDESRAVVTVKCKFNDYDTALKKYSAFAAYRIIPDRTTELSNVPTESLDAVDHLQMFIKYVQENIGTDDITLAELNEVIK